LNKYDWQERYNQLSNDPNFIKEFEKYIRDLILKINTPDKMTMKVDENIYGFIENYVKNKRKNKINQILRKKDI
jgi:hypothetical protein